MMDEDLSLEQMQKEWHGTLRSYLIGFAACILLTATSFSLIIARPFPEWILVHAVIVLALAQAILQLRFFLHLGQEDKPQWETIVFYFMVLVLLIIVLGSLWIMFDLNERVMSHMMEMPHD